MIDRIEQSLVILDDIKEGSSKNKIDLNEIFQYILVRVKAIMFNPDGTPRRSGLVKKALLIAFALELAGKVTLYILDLVKNTSKKMASMSSPKKIQ